MSLSNASLTGFDGWAAGGGGVDGGVSAIVENVSCGDIISVIFCAIITKKMVTYAVEG